jgi:hypothetical protein
LGLFAATDTPFDAAAAATRARIVTYLYMSAKAA